jgi:hypothetical protein
MALNRRWTLFNLYAFTFTDSSQKQIDLREIKPRDDYKVPTLILENVEFRNFLNNYEALIYVENDNIVFQKDTIEKNYFNVYHYGNFEA